MEEFEVNDLVIVIGREGIRGKGTVIEITKGGNYKVKFSNNNTGIYNAGGYLRGKGTWDTNYIKPFNQVEWNEYMLGQKCARLIEKIKQFNYGNLTLDDLTKIEKIIDKE